MAIILDVVLSAGFQLLAGFLKPRKVNNSPDNLPTQQFGEPVPRGWGTFVTPGVLMFAGDPNLNNSVQIDKYTSNNPAENASYASFLHSNPTNPSLLALKLNSLTVATRDNTRYPLTSEIKQQTITDVNGLLRYAQFELRFYNGSQTTVDPMILKNGYGDLQYRGQCFVVIADAIREIYGGRGVSVGAVIQDNFVTPSGTVSGFLGFGDSPAEVQWDFQLSFLTSSSSIPVLRGYQYHAQAAFFNSSSSLFPNAAPSTNIIAGTLTHYRIDDNAYNIRIKTGSNPRFTTNVGQQGKFTTVPYPSSWVNSLTSSVIVGARRGEMREIILSTPGLSPFYSAGGIIRDANGFQVGLCGANEDVMGWNNTIFLKAPVVPNTVPVTSTTAAKTNLSTILTGLLTDLGLSFAITFATDPVITGFSTTNADITGDISNLLACYNKFVYQDRSGVFQFTDYPQIPIAQALKIPIKGHVSDLEIKVEAYDKIPSAINFSYQDEDREYDTSSIRVGNDATRIDNFSLNVACDRFEALRLANSLMARVRTQTITGTLHLKPEYNQVPPGSVCLISKLNASGIDLPVVITRVETGTELTVRLEFINYIELINLVPANANEYGAGTNPITPTFNLDILDTEPRSSAVGLGYITDTPGSILRGGIASPAIVTAKKGSVTSITYTSATINLENAVLQVEQEIYIQDVTTGEGSWNKILSSAIVSPDVYNVTFLSGLYGSLSFSNPTNLEVFVMREESVLNDNYASLSLVKNGQLRTLTYNTRKRRVEPRLTGIIVNSTGVLISRRSVSITTQDDDLTSGTNPLVFWLVRNLTTSVDVQISNTDPLFEVVIALNTNDQLTIQQTDSGYLPLTGAYLNTYTVS